MGGCAYGQGLVDEKSWGPSECQTEPLCATHSHEQDPAVVSECLVENPVTVYLGALLMAQTVSRGCLPMQRVFPTGKVQLPWEKRVRLAQDLP